MNKLMAMVEKRSVSSSVLCSALHKADYVDCSIMWTVLCGMALEPCVIWVFGY